MKKNLLVLITVTFLITIKAQSPALTYTNVTGSNSITCSHPSVNYIASVSNYTSGPLTYTWVSLSGTASGTNISISNPSQYTLTAFNTANSFSLSQVFVVGINTITPTSTVSPVFQNITCPVGSQATFTGITTTTMTNVTHSWYNPYSSGQAANNGTISIYNVSAPGTFTYCLTDNINGCSTCKTVTVSSSSNFPSYSITSPQQFTLGCTTTSVTVIQIANVNTIPAGNPTTYTILPPSYAGPSYGLGASTSYTVNTPGQYTVIVHDISNSCETQIPVSIISKTLAPQISASTNQHTLTCFAPSTLLQGSSTNTNVSFAWAFPGPPAGQMPNDTLTIHTTTNTTNTVVATYTLSVKDNINQCKSTQTLTVYQNIFPPSAIITGPNSISCNTPSITLTNSSISNVPAIFFPTQPVIGSAWYGPVPQTSAANVSSYIAYTPASTANAYTLVAQDLNNGCFAVTTKTVVDNRIYPILSSPPPFNVNCPAPTVAIYPIITGPTSGLTYSWTAPASATVSGVNTTTLTVNSPGVYTIAVTNVISGCSTTTLINVAICVGIEQNLSNNNLSIFPNPNNGLFTLSATNLSNNVEIEIYTILGSKIKTQKITSEKNTIDIQDQTKGVYFIYVTEDNKSVRVFKIVKQ